MKYIKLKKKKSRIYFYFNKIELGYSYREVDGFYTFIFSNEHNNSSWNAYVLREIADILDDLNKEWSDIIDKELYV